MLHLRPLLFFSAAIFMALLLDGCSAERKNVLSKTYHNTTARYNAYFYAKKRIKEIEAILKENIDNDYNNILKIYPELDSTLAVTYQEKIDDCIKKASIAIQRHKNSKWVDDSYIYIGRARYYSLDYVNAIETFKFVNTESEDNDARHEALIRLLRTFVDYKEFENAVAVEDFIKKEKLNKQNQKLLYLNKAHHYQVKEDLDKMLANLVLAAPLLKRKDGKGRIYYIIGQIYQELGFDAEAFNYYRKCLSSNPEYELDFYTRLNMAQVTELGKSNDVRAARKVLNGLLKDSKNKEFKDKIYFEIGEFELKQGNVDDAIENFESSVESSTSNQRQKGHSYLRLGEVYYDTLKSYELAQAYYDSAVQALPQDFENIKAIKARQQILGEFVKNLKIIEVQDSILRLSDLDSVAISAKLNSYLNEEAEKLKEQQKKEERKARRTQVSAFNSNSGISSTGWYFGNPSAVALGQSEFQRIWGDRPLEDNWRRSIKASVQPLNVNNNIADVADNTAIANSQSTVETNAGASLNSLYEQIPFSEDAKQESLDKIENAYYALGNIYKYDLEEDGNAAKTFKTLITRFPETENKPEALYQLYLIYKDLDNQEYNIYKEELLNNFPQTIYAKLISNPNYTEESTATNEKLKKIYESAYGYFTQEKYDTALYILNDGVENYEETVFTSRLKLLKILITGKLEDINLYQYQLSEFIKNNPDSEVAPYAEELLTASRSFLERKRKRLGTEYVKYLEQSHYLVYVYETKSGLTDVISEAIDSYNNEFSELNLKTSNLILDDNLAMILVSDFEDKEKAFEYYSEFVISDPIDEAKRNSKFYKFVITKDNFNIFYQSKDLEAYLRFFEKNYINGIN